MVGLYALQAMDVCHLLICACVVLRMQGPCDGKISCPRSPTKCQGFIDSEINSELEQTRGPDTQSIS
jgi:hypothetical protein